MKGIVLCVVFVLAGARPGLGWGFYAHQLINYHAVFLLPPEMMPLFKPYILYISERAVDPDKRRYAVPEEAARHYIDLDKYPNGTYASMKMGWNEAVNKFTEDTLKSHGIVPWWIQVMHGRLTKAFSEKDIKRILKLSAELGHYIGDAHVPLHTSSNHNGQHTGQHGIHGFWESRVPELLAEKEWDFWIGAASYVKNPLAYTWRIVHESAAACDSVLKFEEALNKRFPAGGKYAFENRNGVIVRQYSEKYARDYDRMLNGMIERRFRQSVIAVASFWYTAWVNAGQPDCRTIAGAKRDSIPDDELATLNRKWKEGKIVGKSCE